MPKRNAVKLTIRVEVTETKFIEKTIVGKEKISRILMKGGLLTDKVKELLKSSKQ